VPFRSIVNYPDDMAAGVVRQCGFMRLFFPGIRIMVSAAAGGVGLPYPDDKTGEKEPEDREKKEPGCGNPHLTLN
jgi:hypothetical protein